MIVFNYLLLSPDFSFFDECPIYQLHTYGLRIKYPLFELRSIFLADDDAVV